MHERGGAVRAQLFVACGELCEARERKGGREGGEGGCEFTGDNNPPAMLRLHT